MLDYIPLGILVFVGITIFYGFIVIQDIVAQMALRPMMTPRSLLMGFQAGYLQQG